MPAKLTVQALRDSGSWLHMSHAERQRRLAEERGGSARFAACRPDFPKNISPAARRIFKELVSLLAERRTLTRADGQLLKIYSVVFSRHEEALMHLENEGTLIDREFVDRNGNARTVRAVNPFLAIAEKCERSLVGIIAQLGLSPVSRDKVKAAAPAAPGSTQMPSDLIPIR